MTDQAQVHTSSTGHAMAGGAWLDAHFEMNRAEYEAQLRAVGIQPGWHVLDAACGSGSFLPWLADLVGPEGRLAALDLAPENVALVEQRVAQWGLAYPVEARVGTVLALPYPDAAFDAVWFANTSQYLTDAELTKALAELRRVVRPGGLVAVKEADGTLSRQLPGPPGLTVRLGQQAGREGDVQAAGWMRAPLLPSRLRSAGLVDVWGRMTIIERSAPLDALTRQHKRDLLPAWAGIAATLDLPQEDQEAWARFRDPDKLERYLDDRDFWSCEANILTVGTVPDRAV